MFNAEYMWKLENKKWENYIQMAAFKRETLQVKMNVESQNIGSKIGQAGNRETDIKNEGPGDRLKKMKCT